MDLTVLRRLVLELDGRLQGERLGEIFALPRHHLALILGSRTAPRLWFSAESEEPHLYLRHGSHDSPAQPPAFAMAARKQLRGRRILHLKLLGDDRVVELVTHGANSGRLVFELVPRRAAAYLLKADGQVRAIWCPRKGRPQVGEPYEPPRPMIRTAVNQMSPHDWDRAAIGDTSNVRRNLLCIDGFTTLIAAEVAWLHEQGEDLRSAAIEELKRANDAPTNVRLYSLAPLEQLTDLPPAAKLLCSPYPVQHLTGLHKVPYPDLISATTNLYPRRAELKALTEQRRALIKTLLTAQARVNRSRAITETDPTSTADALLLRQHGDLLLANAHVQVEDGRVSVADLHGDGNLVTIDVDPSLDVIANAQRFYQRAKRATRGARHVARRRAELAKQANLLERLRTKLTRADGLDACNEVIREVGRLRIRQSSNLIPNPEAPVTQSQDQQGRRSPQHGTKTNSLAGIMSFLSSDGFEILVGRNAEANDRLTHSEAAPDDWWCHTEGSGSHVVLRNPTRDKAPPAQALNEAAALAGYYSKSRFACKVNVHWTRAQNVRRSRRGPKGLALIRRHRTLMVKPCAPEELFGSDPAEGEKG